MRHTNSKWHVAPLKRMAEFNCADCTCLCKRGFIQARLSVKISRAEVFGKMGCVLSTVVAG